MRCGGSARSLSSSGGGSSSASGRIAPHRGSEARERERLLRCRAGEEPLPPPPAYVKTFRNHGIPHCGAVPRTPSSSLSSPPEGKKFTPPTRTLSPSRRRSPIHSVDIEICRKAVASVAPPELLPLQPGELQLESSSELQPPPPPLEVHEPTYAVVHEPMSAVVHEPTYAVVHDAVVHEPTSAVVHEAVQVSDGNVFSAIDTALNTCQRHLIRQGTVSARTAAQWANSLRPDNNKPDLVSPRASCVHPQWDRERRRMPTLRCATSQPAHPQPPPLRVTICGHDKWTNTGWQHWVVSPLERLESLCRRLGLAEPEEPGNDSSFGGFVLTVPARSLSWRSAGNSNISVGAFGIRSGDEITVTTVWTQYRSAPRAPAC